MKRPASATGAYVALALAVVLLVLARGSFAAAGLGTDIAVLALLAVGLQVTFGLGGALNLALAPTGALGGYVVGTLAAHRGWSFWPALPLGILASALLAAIVGLPCLRVRGDVLALVTLGAGEVLSDVYLNTRTLFGGYDGVSAIPPVSVGGAALSGTGLLVVAAALLTVAVSAVAALAASPLGRSWRAVRDDEVGAASLGLATGALRVGAFAVGGAVAGAAGALYAVQESFISSTAFDLTRTVNVILVVLVAGSGALGRTVVVAGALTVLSDRLSQYAAVSEAVTGILILVLVAQRLGAPGIISGALRNSLRHRRIVL